MGKLLKILYSEPKEMRFENIDKILRRYGYIPDQPDTGSSHYTYRKKGKDPLTIPRHSRIKRVYVRLVAKTVKEENHENS